MIPGATGVEDTPRRFPSDGMRLSLHTKHLNVEDDRPIVASWASEIRALTEEQRERFLKEMPDGDLYKFANGIERVIIQRIKSSRTLQAAEWATPLGQLVDMTKPFAESIQSAFPPAGLILGGISLLLTTTKKFVDYQESVILFLQKALTNLNILEKFKSTIPKTKEIQLLLIAIYGDLVEFLAKAVKPFLDKDGQDRITLVPIAKSIWKPFDAGFGKLEKKLDNDLSALDRALVFHSQEEQIASSRLQQRTYGLLQGAEKRRTVLDLENEAKEAAKEREELRREILHWIPHSSFDHIQDEKHHNSLPSTGGWLFDHGDFGAWKDSRGPSNLLWITGKAGSGKSHLAAHIIHNIRESCRSHRSQLTQEHGGKVHALAFIYCSTNANASTSSAPVPYISTLLGSVLRQLYAQLPKAENVESISRRYKESNFESLRRAEIKDGIVEIVRQFAQTYIVVDGLDECSGLPGNDFKDISQFFGSLATNGSIKPAHVAIFSRPGYSTISIALQKAIQIRVDDGSNTNDIKNFIEERTMDLAKKPSALQQIQDGLLNRADGVFLWVSLSIKIIEMETSDRAKVLASKSTLRGLDDLYSELLQRVLAQPKPRRDLALRALLWIANSQEPLSKNELVHVLSFEPGMTSLDSDDIIDEKIILPICADLVVVKHDRYELLHFSLGEFLKTEYAVNSVYSNHPRGEEDEPNTVLARTCMSYLMLDDFQGGAANTLEAFESLAEKYPLLRYAALHWGDCLRCGMSPQNINLACDMLQISEMRDFATQVRDFYLGRGHELIFPWPGQVQPLHVIACFGLEGLLDRFPQIISQIDSPDGFSWYPIDYAVKMKQKSMFEWILSHKDTIENEVTATVPLNSYHPLVVAAAKNDWADIVYSLIAAGFNKDERDNSCSTAWHFAAYHGDMDTAGVLIKAGANTTSQDEVGNTTLMIAACRGHVEMAKLLLEHGADADVNVQNEDGMTALHFAALFVKEDALVGIISLLCNHGADIEMREKHGYTPLHASAVTDNTAALKHLLALGADLTKQFAEGTILHVAAARGSSQVLKYLLRKGEMNEILSNTLVHGEGESRELLAALSTSSDGYNHQLAEVSLLNTNETSGEWPIHKAAWNGHLECVTYLYNFDSNQVNQKSTRGFTPLHAAVQGRKLAVVNFLLDRGADVNAMSGPEDLELTPLHIAIHSTKADIVNTLLRKGADPSSGNRFGDTVWDYATRFGNPEIVRDVLNHYSTLRDEKDTLLLELQSAIVHQNIKVVAMLLSLHGNLSLLSKMEDSNIGLLAVQGGSLEIWKMLVSCHSSLAHGMNSSGCNALHFAAIYGRTDILDYLCDQRFNMDQQDSHGRSPIIMAALSYMTGCIKILCDKGASINHADSYGHTALHYSARSGSIAAVELLLRAGSDTHIRGLAGLSAADYASSDTLAVLRSWEEIHYMSNSLSDAPKGKEGILYIIHKLQNPGVLGEERRIHLDILGDLLWKFRAYREACLLFGSKASRECDFCRRIVEAPFYHCTKCLDIDVCPSCHEALVHGMGFSLIRLESLELALQPVRRALQHAIQFGTTTLLRVIDSVEGTYEYFQEALGQYSDWTMHCNPNGQLFTRRFPGWVLVLIIHELKSSKTGVAKTEGPENLADMDPGLFVLGRDDPEYPLRYLSRFRSPAREIVPFSCYSHTFHRVRDLDELSDEEKILLEERGDMPEFLKELEENFASFEVNAGNVGTEYKWLSAEGKMDVSISGDYLGDRAKLQLAGAKDPVSVAPIQVTPSLSSPIVSRIDIDEARETLVQKMRSLEPDDDSRTRGDGMILETAWSLVQAIVYGDEAYFPSLIELMKASAE